MPRIKETVWSIAAAGICLIYFLSYTKPVHHPTLLHVLDSPLSSMLYFVAVPGSPLGHNLFLALLGGLFLIVITVGMYIRQIRCEQRFEFTFWDALIFFSLLSNLMLTIGRSGFGVSQAFASRYTTFTILGIVALYVRAEVASYLGRLAKPFQLALLGMILHGIVTSYSFGARNGAALRISRLDEARTVKGLIQRFDKVTAHNISYLAPARLYELILFLKNNELSIFNSQTGQERQRSK